MLRPNKKKALVVTDNYIEYYGIEKALDLNSYRSENVKSTDLINVKARLIVVVLDRVDKNFLYICRENHNQIIPTPMLVILKNKKDFKKLDMDKLKINACIFYDDDIEQFHEAIYKIQNDERYVSPSIFEEKSENFLNKLTRRQYEICMLTANGNSVKDVAKNLNISEKTVRNQISLINKSIEPKTFIQAVIEYLNENSNAY